MMEEEKDINRPLPHTGDYDPQKGSKSLIDKMALFGFVFIPIGIAVFFIDAYFFTQIIPDKIARLSDEEAYAIEVCRKGQTVRVADLITKYAKEGHTWAQEELLKDSFVWNGSNEELQEYLHQEADKRNPFAFKMLLSCGDTYAIDNGLNMNGDYICEMANRLMFSEKQIRTIGLLEMAYERGSAKAAHDLYLIYSNQQEIPSWATDSVLAAKWLKIGAEMGHLDSMRDISECYETGKIGFKRDKAKAAYWKKRVEEYRPDPTDSPDTIKKTNQL